MHNGWIKTTLGELCDRGQAMIQTGPFGSQLHSYDYQISGVPVVPTEGIGRRRIRDDAIPRVSEAVVDRLARHKLRAGDILFARRGAQATGLSALVESKHAGWLCGTGAILMRLETADVDPAFLSFLFSSDIVVSWLKAHAVGAVMPNLNEGILRRLPLLLPPLKEQQAIAHVLGTLDKKIELNRRTTETLGAMARALFQSWFVDFDPVRAKTEGRDPGLPIPLADLFPDSFEGSEVGKIPKGWGLMSLPSVIDVNPTRALLKGAIAPYLDMANMPTRGHSPDEVIDRPFGSGMRFVNGDTLVARITPCLENGKTAYVDFLEDGQVGWGSTEYIVLRPKMPLPTEFAYCLARGDAFRDFAIQSMTGSSGRQRVPADSFSHFLVVSPSKEVAEIFGRLVKPLFARARMAVEESRVLSSLRDALLPQLLEGQIRPNSVNHGMTQQ